MKNIFKLTLPAALIVVLAFGFPPAKLTVTSSAFTQNGKIPVKYSCQGANISPPLNISGIPAGTKSLAIIVHDPDAPHLGGVTHWIAWNLPADGQISENFKGGQQGLNSDNNNGYMGMCPPDGIHHYNFNVYALNAMLQLSATADKTGVENAMQGHILAQGEITGLYSKNK